MNKIAILHHGSDMDGIFSGLLAKNLFQGYCEFDLIPVEYGEPFDYGLLNSHNVIVITDFSYDPETMMKIHAAKGGDFYWYDHHYKAIDDSVVYSYANINGSRCDGISAVKLVAMDCSINSPLVGLLNAYDIHDTRHVEYYNTAKALNYYLNSRSKIDLENIANDINVISEFSINNMIMCGRTVWDYELNRVKKMKPISISIQGENMLAYNGYSSDLLEVSGEERIAMFTVSTNHVTFSLRSKTSDVSQIAIAMGGGGHKQACGFKLPLDEFHILLG